MSPVIPFIASNAHQRHACLSCDDPLTPVFLGGLLLIVLGLFVSMFWMTWRMR